jgi:tetratricopeptide (TPR) repeat protein
MPAHFFIVEEAVCRYSKVFQMEPNGKNQVKIARGMCEKGLWPAVLAFAQNWREKDPSDYQALYYIGLGLSGMGQFAMAETAYRGALALETTDARVWNNLGGLLCEKLQRPSEGIRCLEQGLKMDPHNKLAWSNLATMAGRMGHHHKALEYADRALALDPKLVEAYLHKATAAKALKKMDVVKEVCHKLGTIEPEKFCRGH